MSGSEKLNLLLSDDGLGVHAIQRLIQSKRLPEEVQVLDGGTLGMDLLVNTAAKTHAITGGQYNVPMVLRTPCGAMDKARWP